MNIKSIAIGNRLMGDDQIGILVLEALESQLRTKNIDVIISETDVYYALNNIENGDYLFIIDSTYYNTIPGKVTIMSIKDAFNQQQQFYSQHQANLIKLLKIYKKAVMGFIIGIEVNDINYKIGLSDILNKKLSNITREINEFIDCTIKMMNIR